MSIEVDFFADEMKDVDPKFETLLKQFVQAYENGDRFAADGNEK